MPASTLERSCASAVAVTPGSGESTPEKGRTSENRKSSKPIMEKRRRARINESLSQLKTLILDALKKDSSRHSKLEKADILEMTVKHLRNMQHLQITAVVTSDPCVVGKYRAGFSECVGEVTRFLSTCDGVTAEVRTRLLAHLAACASHINAINLYTPPHLVAPGLGAQAAPPLQTTTPLQTIATSPAVASKGVLAVQEAASMLGGFRLVPTPDGHFAFLVPSAAVAPPPAQSSLPVSNVAPPATADSVWRPW